MTLRRPAARLRRAPGWRRSGDESYWESLMSEGEFVPRVSHPPRAPRPQSAIEGGQLDSWLEHLQRMQSDLLRAPVQDQAPIFNDRTTSMPALNREQTGRTWRHQVPSFSGGSSTCVSPSLFESSLGSQESLQTGCFSPLECKGSWERAHIMQAPRKEQPQLSYLSPVKIGWLPVQRRVMMVADACNKNQSLDHSAAQVKLKQPITPMFQKNQATAKIQGTNSDPNRKSPLMKTNSTEPFKHTPLHRATSAEPCRPHTLLQGANSTETYKSHTPVCRTGSVQPIRATAPLHTTYSSSQPSHTQTNSAVTTLMPQNKAGFSSITISSRKVSRSASLPGSDTCNHSSQSSESTSPPQSHLPMDPNSRHVRVQRKATIVKVTEQRVMSSHVPSTESTGTPPASHSLDTVVHRRKATIIKVTERRESYSPAKAGSGMRHPEYRHSYTEGVLKDNNAWRQGSHSQHIAAPSYHKSDSTKRPNTAVTPHTSTSDPERNGGALHRSTLNLFVSNTPAIAAPPAPSEVSPRAVGQRSERPRRPLSCYGNVFGHTEPSKENVTQPAARKWSFGLPQETNINPVNSDSSFISPGTAVKKAGQLVADTPKPNRGEKEISQLPEDAARRASPSLTLIKAPDPHLYQTPEEVLKLNAAAIIANIKLQRQLSKKKTPKDNPEKDSAVPTQGNTGGTAEIQTRLHQPFPRQSARAGAKGRRKEAAGTVSRPTVTYCPQAGEASPQRPPYLSESTPAQVKRKKDEEKKEEKKEVCLTNRQRVELFKKLLDQLLQRNNN
ncbi:hypothetical protein INR49_005677 [Caranx melampygus]|nr:hypothetical protein INR49_005677 [Caranx melampygus]